MSVRTDRIVSGKTSHAVEDEDGWGGMLSRIRENRRGRTRGSRFSLQAQTRASARAHACMRGDVSESRRGERMKPERASARKKCSASGIVDSLES